MKVGFVGVGSMGRGMAMNAIAKGFEVFVYDLSAERLADICARGATASASVHELGAAVDVSVTMLPIAPVEPALEQAVAGPEGLLTSMRRGGVILDGGNTSPQLARRLASLCRDHGIDFLDAPVSGGPQGADAGTLSIMVGGELAALERIRPLLEAFGSSIKHFGPVGSGQLTKLINNMMVANNLASMSEALVLASKLGLDIEQVFETVRHGAAGSWVLENYAPIILGRREGVEKPPDGGFGPRGGRDRQLAWAMDLAAPIDLPMLVTTASHELFKAARASGHSGICEPVIEFLEQLTGADVRVVHREEWSE